MLERFECPDKETILVPDCLKQCRLGRRCMTLPSLVMISHEREWTGEASTTQLLDGTMLAYLKLTKPYTVIPDNRAFMMYGSWHHKGLEDVGEEIGMATEVALSIDRDIFDLIEVENNEIVLTDYKLWGSYKVAKALGITKTGTKPDPSGAVYKTTSKYGKAGDPKMVSVFAQVPANADNWEAEYQLNRYRVKLLDEFKVGVQRLQLQVTVRDGGLAVALNRGIEKKVYMMPIKLLPDEDVRGYFAFKAENLDRALTYGWSEPCTQAECWDGVRCTNYCDVKMHCPKGQLMDKLDKGEDDG